MGPPRDIESPQQIHQLQCQRGGVHNLAELLQPRLVAGVYVFALAAEC